MKSFSIVIAITVLASANIMCQEKGKVSEKMNKRNSTNACLENSDSLYNRKETLEKLGFVLDETMISYYNAKYRIKKRPAKNPKFVVDERPNGFFVFDLTDISNTGKPLGKCIEFKDNHIYHFAFIDIPYSFSHIAVLEDGNVKIFKAINCRDGDSIEDVINYLSQRPEGVENKSGLLNRVRDYRKYGIYSTVDDDDLRCPKP
ncbi:MAG: hypothetical protein LC113_10645 [Acidobacteria bacterium]|nr:hypothetical protein [Acidobacteriota bacterium]